MSVAVDPSGRFVYVAAGDVLAYRIDPLTGRLTPLPGSPFPAGIGATSLAVDPLDRFVYVTNQSSNSVSGLTINSATGALTLISGSPFAAGTAPQSIAIDPLGRYVYVANQGSDNVSGYLIDQTTGALGPMGGPFAAGSGGLYGITVDPSGKYVYASGYGGIYAYSIGFVNTCNPFPHCVSAGALTLVPGSPFGTGTNVAYGLWTPNSVAWTTTAHSPTPQMDPTARAM
jgi:6-phosphogluconolactonase